MSEETAVAAEGTPEVAPEATGTPAETIAEPALTTEPPSWTDGFSELELGHVLNKSWKTPQDAVQGAMNAESHIGVPPDRLIKLPHDPTEAGAMDMVWDKLGRPVDPSAYKFADVPEALQEGSEEIIASFRKKAHETGISQDAAAKMFDWYMANQSEGLESMATTTLETQLAQEADLKRDWGTAYVANVEIGKKAKQQLGLSDEDIDGLEDSLGTRRTIEMLNKLGRSLMVTEHNLDPSTGESTFGLSESMASAKATALLDEIKNDPERLSRYLQKQGKDYTDLTNLYKIANG